MARRWGSTSWARKAPSVDVSRVKIGSAKVSTKVSKSSSGKASEPLHDAQVASAVKRGGKGTQTGVPAGNYVRNPKHREK